MKREILKLKVPKIDFDRVGRDPGKWLAYAGHLLAAAELLWLPISKGLDGYRATRSSRTREQAADFEQQVRYRGPFFLLAGLAVEVALKALIVQGAIAASPSQGVKDILRLFPSSPHNLKELAKRARLTPTPSEDALLERLSRWIRWAGRYPIPLNPGEADFERTTRDCDYDEVRAFIRRTQREFARRGNTP